MRPAALPPAAAMGLSTLPRAALCAAGAASTLLLARQQQRRRQATSAAAAAAPCALEPPEASPAAHRTRLGKHAAAGRLVAAAALSAGGSWTGLLLSVRAGKLMERLWMLLAVSVGALTRLVADALPAVLQLAEAPGRPARPAIDREAVRAVCGYWVKDMSRSDSMDAFCDLFGVPRWLRSATRLMGALDIQVAGDCLVVKQVCRLSWLSTSESFPLDGSPSAPHKRRDMRGGKQVGHLEAAGGGRVQVRVVWQGAPEGEARDTLQLVQPGGGGGSGAEELVVLHEAALTGRGSAAFKEVFTRRRQ